MHLLDKLSLKQKLLLMLFFPIFGVTVLSLAATVDRYMAYHGLARVERLAQLAGATVTPVPGERANIKVTVPEDIEIITALLQSRMDSGAEENALLTGAHRSG